MTFYSLRLNAPARYGSLFSARIQTFINSRNAQTNVTNVGFHAFPASEDEDDREELSRRPSNGWESTARLLRVLASTGSAPVVGRA